MEDWRENVGVEVVPAEGDGDGRAGDEAVEGLVEALLLGREGGDGGLQLRRRHRGRVGLGRNRNGNRRRGRE